MELVAGLIGIVGAVIRQCIGIAQAAGVEDAFLAALDVHFAAHTAEVERKIKERHALDGRRT